jgi:hypothetical protein
MPKLDLRVISSSAATIPDVSVGEFAKQCTASKMYLDKLKLALISKLHLNYYVQKLKNKEVFVPFLLIMGFDCQVLLLRLAESRLYLVEHVSTFSFPITKTHINQGGIEEMINVLSYLRVSISLQATRRDQPIPQ